MSLLSKAKKIVCIGRNYAAHIKELNNAVPIEPFYFLKPSSSIVEPGKGSIQIPDKVLAHYEVELGLIMGDKLKAGASVPDDTAMAAIGGYFVAIDMTARNVQDAAKKKGLPWTIAKGYDTFLPVGPILPKTAIPDPHNVILELLKNGKRVQYDNTSLMLNRIPRILSAITESMSLEPGDLVLTGTPKGVGPVSPGDVLEAKLRDASGNEISQSGFSINAVAR
ncbi:fumarylacetoacetate hydrolase [Schizosaccharomyces japonicus yFS275]|uniref:Fumarylacetoacetate hydrolase n=1 Tax=Schizosaccharomyces japonicus (strain yFS275 / FY16936) TaxID=402676 RepID=B6JVS6_SCHJY|nr:fumarylacetoacetate hydrolase [Schizosaccharomyces japonicus yFS275]EEB05477.1 fumarylacetoacetate hydrolase [Schizosaccharomyces japonicus yFS275]